MECLLPIGIDHQSQNFELNMTTPEFTHGLTDFGIAGSHGKTLVLGGRWFAHQKKERDLDQLESIVVRETGIGQPWKELNFNQLCEDFPDIQYIDIEYENIDNLDWVVGLSKLKHLGIRCKTLRKENVQRTALDLLSMDVTGHEALLSLNSPSVEILKVWGYKEESLNKIKSDRLRILDIIRAPKLISLQGLDEFESLSELSIYSAPKLYDFSSVATSQSLRKLSFQSCKSLEPPIGESGGPLTYLSLLDCGNISNVHWIGLFRALEYLRIGGTTVVDGKVEFLKQIPGIKTLFVENRRQYDCTFDN